MLRVCGVSKAFGTTVVLNNVDLDVGERDRIALVGANGVGKSTLLKIILSDLEPDRGSVQMSSSISAAYLPQDAHCSSDRTLHNEMLSVFANIIGLEERQRDLERHMAQLAPEDPQLMHLVNEHSHLQDEFGRLGGYTVEAEIGRVLSGLGFLPADYDRTVQDFSGGWQMRIALAKLLLQSPSLLLLDEPTNHLDVTAVEWLEGYLRDYSGSFIVVSHDRYFMDRLAERTIELVDGRLVEYHGNYSAFLSEKARRREAQQAAHERQQEYLQRQQAYVDRFRASARRASQAQSREKMLGRMELIDAPDAPERGIRFRFPPSPRSGREVLLVRGIAKGYGDQTVFSNCNLRIEWGDRVALVGENGAGKSTLLRLLAGVEKPDRGTIHIGLNVHRAYYAQHQVETLDEEKTVFEEVYSASPAGWTVGEVRSLLGRFLFTQEDAFKRISVLSGGERARVALAKMLLRPSNLLLLDEPTNHLDLATRETLETALRAYEGSLVLVSHDRYLIDRIATRVVEIADESATTYEGNYSYYARKKTAIATTTSEEANRTPSRPRESQGVNGPTSKDRQPSSMGKLATLERKIIGLEERLRVLEEQLGRPDLYADPIRARSSVTEYENLRAELADLYTRWEQLGLQMESA